MWGFAYLQDIHTSFFLWNSWIWLKPQWWIQTQRHENTTRNTGSGFRNAGFLVNYFNYFFKIDFIMKHLPKSIMISLTRRSVGPVMLTNYEWPDSYHFAFFITELSSSWEAVICAATQELPSILRNPKVHHRVHKSPLAVPILSQIDPVHIISSYLSKIYFNIIHTPKYWSS
jgi:hypothetical protein